MSEPLDPDSETRKQWPPNRLLMAYFCVVPEDCAAQLKDGTAISVAHILVAVIDEIRTLLNE